MDLQVIDAEVDGFTTLKKKRRRIKELKQFVM